MKSAVGCGNILKRCTTSVPINEERKQARVRRTIEVPGILGNAAVPSTISENAKEARLTNTDEGSEFLENAGFTVVSFDESVKKPFLERKLSSESSFESSNELSWDGISEASFDLSVVDGLEVVNRGTSDSDSEFESHVGSRADMLAGSVDESSDDEETDTSVACEDEVRCNWQQERCPSILDHDTVVSSGNVCLNCHRCECSGFDGLSCYDVKLKACVIGEICFASKKWKTFNKKDCDVDGFDLCEQCYEVLSIFEQKKRKDEKKTTLGWISVWPVYIWKFISDGVLLQEHGLDVLRFIPLEWHGYWLDELAKLLPGSRMDIVELYALRKACWEGFSVDVTLKRLWFAKVRGCLALGMMKAVCSSLMVPVCLCPWGCSCYYFENGSCSMDALLHRYFPSVLSSGSFCSRVEIDKLVSAREDFFGEADMHLFNPIWKVLPSVYFLDGVGPVFVTCSEHNRGSALKYFHLPKTGNCIPSRHAESLSLAVFRSRTLKPTIPMKYSNGYRLQKCMASYCGVDTAFVSEKRYFDHTSHLDDINETRAFAYRDDIKCLAANLVQSGELSEEYLSNLRSRSKALFGNRGASAVCGSTFMRLSEVIKLQRMLSVTGVLEVETGGGKQRSFYPNWPAFLLFVHQNDGFGSKMFEVPMFKSIKGKQPVSKCFPMMTFWFVCQCVCSVSELWEELHIAVQKEDACQGFLLSYLARTVTKQSIGRDKKRNPFYVAKGHDLMRAGNLQRLLLDGKDATSKLPEEVLAIVGDCFNRERVNILRLRNGMEGLSLNEKVHRLGGCTETCRVLMLHGENCNFEDKFTVDGHVLELRLLALSDGDCVFGRPNFWNGEVWRRHGGIFTRWWVSCRSSSSTQTRKEKDLSKCQLEKVVFVIYCKVEDATYCDYKREYLKYIGGQSHIYCKTHDVPLITSKVFRKVSGKRCCNVVHGAECTKQEDICCPFEECSVCVCKSCKMGCDRDHVTFFEKHDNSGNVFGLPAFDRRGKEDATEDISDGGDGCVIFDSESEDGMSCENVNVSVLHTGCDVAMFDLEHAPEDDSPDYVVEDEVAYSGIIPTTLCGGTPATFGNTLGTMGTSVLLNKFGTVLVRRDNRLQATRRERNLVERVVARDNNNCVPLIYLEGMLFPSIFFDQSHSSQGGLLGSIPTALFCQHETRKRFQIASVAEHAKIRLKSCGSSASTNPNYLTFLFDCLANGALEGQDTRVVLSRGFEESMGPAGMRMRNGEDDFYTDTIDNRQCCHNLCASEREQRNSLFVTLTCNQREHFGLSHVKRYVDSDECLHNYKRYMKNKFPTEPELSAREEAEVRFGMQEAARNLIVRNWLEVRLLLIRYILHSPETPLGDEVLKIFARDEYQTDSGNLSHIHMLVTLAEGYDSVEGRKKIKAVIRGFVDEIVGLDEVESLIAEGILESWEDYWKMKEQASCILPHSCDSYRCLRRVGPNKNELVCRVPDTRKLSLDMMAFYEKPIEVEHNSDAIKIYERLGFCESMLSTGGVFVPESDFLQPKRILAPARFGEGNITPVVGRLFAATRSSMNVQICTSFGTSRYVVKYITKIDENNYVVFSVKEGSNDVYKAELVNLHNTKVSSSAFHEKAKLKKSRHHRRPKGRAIAATEMMQVMLGYPQVYTNVEYIKVQTLPLGDRPGLERLSPTEKYNQLLKSGYWTEGKAPDIYDFCVPDIERRRALFHKKKKFFFRMFTQAQVNLLEDQMHSPVTVDKVTIFGVRPPELLFVDKMEWYFRYFERGKQSVYKTGTFDTMVTLDLYTSYWVDGLGNRIRLRPRGITKLEEIFAFEGFRERTRQKGFAVMLKLFDDIFGFFKTDGVTYGKKNNSSGLGRVSSLIWGGIQHAMIAHELGDAMLPIPVFSNVRPKNATKFIIHLLLSMGHFETEIDLWNNFSLRESFVRAGLVDVDDVTLLNAASVDGLLKFWIEDQLQYYPISSRVLDDYVCSAEAILCSVLLRDAIPINEVPSYLYTSLVHDTATKTMEYKQKVKADLITATLNGLGTTNQLPSCEQLMKCTKASCVLECSFGKSDTQSEESYWEQQRILCLGKNAIDEYCSPCTVATMNVVITGPPGVGKTHCLLQCVLFALCRGLFAMTTAMLAERAFLLGGQHFHKLFRLPVRENGYRVHRMAELAVISLQKKPESISMLRCLDVLFVDEMGQLSAELLSVLDIIMRRIRDSSLFMGGILIIGTLDQMQLRPIKELPFLISPYVLTCFRMARLQKYVRCSDCVVLQEMNEIARFFSNVPCVLEDKMMRFRSLVSENCTFLNTWEELEEVDDVLRIFPKKKHALQSTKSFLLNKKKKVVAIGGEYRSVVAQDTMVAMESHGEWTAASKPVINYLNRKASEPEYLDFFVGAVYQFTFNSPNKHNTTQLGVLFDVPSQEDLDGFTPIKIMVAPAGTKIIDIKGRKKEDLEGWREVLVSAAPEYTQPMRHQGVKAKRKQYGLKHHVASTVHSAIGHTLIRVATQLSAAHGVWERAMVVVLISRVKHARDIIFIGNKEENIAALIKGLQIRCQYDEYMNHIVDVLCGDSSPESPGLRTVEQRYHPYRPKDIELPLDTSGVVYLLVSTINQKKLYVGCTQNIRLRLKQHNSGYGSLGTASADLRPWALVAFVTGFAADRKLMHEFETSWQQKNQYFCPHSLQASIDLAEELIQERYCESHLLLVNSLC